MSVCVSINSTTHKDKKVLYRDEKSAGGVLSVFMLHDECTIMRL